VTAVLLKGEQGQDHSLGTFQGGNPLTKMKFVIKMKEALAVAGMDCTAYSHHSFRSGAATTVAKQGITDGAIKMLGRRRSSAYQLYNVIWTPWEQLASYSQTLGKALGH
jgi:site-specific recombinase XerD